MKIILEFDDGRDNVVFTEVSDVYIAVRQLKPGITDAGKQCLIAETTSHSWGSALRELVKELTQSIAELQDLLKAARDASSQRSDRSMAFDNRDDSNGVDPRNRPRW